MTHLVESPSGLASGAPRPAPSRSILIRSVAEGVGTFFLLIAVVGSGIAGERLAGGNAAIALLANSAATGAGLAALILAFGPVSGAHFNPLVSLVEASFHELPRSDVPFYVLAQSVGAVAGAGAAHLMFGLPLYAASRHVRTGAPQWLAETVATFGLVIVIRGAARLGTVAVAIAVGCYIAGAYWFTASTSFANPAVTLARSLTDSFSGIRPADAPGFVAAQLAGAWAGAGFSRRVFHLPD